MSAEINRPGPKRCALYIRVSTAMQRMEGWSLDAQRAGLTRYAEQKGWKVVGVYADEGKTARKRLKDRREIFRLLDDVAAGQIDIILFKELDRWFRNVSDFYKVQDVLDKYDVPWVSERQPNLDMRTKEGRLAANIMLSVGQNEADACSERIKYTNKYLLSQKRWTAGDWTLPKGYTLDDEQHVIIDEKQEPFIRDFLAGIIRLQSIRRAMLEANAAHGQEYRYDGAYHLARNTMLYGEYNGVPDFVEKPYLTREEYDLIQDIARRNVKTGQKYDYIFSGLIKCSICGRNLGGVRGGKKGHARSYRCGPAAMERCHPFVQITEKKMERLLFPYVQEALAGTIAEVTEVQQARKRARPKCNREQIEKKLDKLEDLYINSERMTKEKYEERKAAILAQLIEPEPEEQLPEIKDLEAIQAIFDAGIDAAYEGMTNLEKRAFWRGILNSVTIKTGEITAVDFKA